MRGVKEDISMEDINTDSKRKITPSIPANYISILDLQERWMKEKERKREEERRRKQQAEEHQTKQEDLKKAEVKGKQEDLDETRLTPSNRKKHWGRGSNKNESFDAGEAKWSEKEETSPRGEDEGLLEKKRGFRRKRYNIKKKKKKKNQEVGAVKEGVVDECGSSLPVEYTVTVTENNTPVKDHRKKSEKAMGKRSVEYGEKAVVTDDSTAIETQFEDLSINRGEERGEAKNLERRRRSSNRITTNQRRVRMPTQTATMVWVKKGQNERPDDGSGSGVKPLLSS